MALYDRGELEDQITSRLSSGNKLRAADLRSVLLDLLENTLHLSELGEAFSVEGNVLVLTTRNNDGTLSELRFTGGVQAGTYLRRAATRGDVNFVASDFTATSEHESITPPDFSVASYIAFWIPATALEPTDIRLQGAPLNAFNHLMVGPLAQSVDGVAGYYWRTNHALPSANSGRVWAVTSTGHLRTFRRYFAQQRGVANDTIPTFTPSDFTTGDEQSSSSFVSEILAPRFSMLPGSTADHRWLAFSVPDESPDIVVQFASALGGTSAIGIDRQPGTISIDQILYKVFRIPTRSRYFRSATLYRITQ